MPVVEASLAVGVTPTMFGVYSPRLSSSGCVPLLSETTTWTGFTAPT